MRYVVLTVIESGIIVVIRSQVQILPPVPRKEIFMKITKEQLKKYRELAENTAMVSALGEYTPLEFIELLDYIEELEEQLSELQTKEE